MHHSGKHIASATVAAAAFYSTKFRQDNSLASLNSREGPVSIKRRRILLHMFKSLFDWCGVSYERVLEMQRTTFLLDLQMLLERDQLRARVR